MPGTSTFIDPPTPEEIRRAARTHYIDLTDEEVEYVREVIRESLETYHRLDRIPEPSRERRYTDRDPGYRPDEDEDPLNAFVTRCSIEGADEGPLEGYTVGLKDNISVAGIEMTAGSSVLDGYVPKHDATVATRLLDGGGTIVGKLNLHAFSFFGGSEADVPNPHDPDRTAGGSSSGSAVAVVEESVDVALGGDQGGSIRGPAALTGCVGLKPTWGLVPFTGIMSIDDTLDFTGPMTRTVEDCARVLDVIAGPDPDDPRQRSVDVETRDYTGALDVDAEELTVGVLDEGFHAAVDDAVADTVRSAVSDLEAAGATVTEVSVPEHPDGTAIWLGILHEGIAAKISQEGLSPFTKGFYDTQYASEFGKARRVHADDYPPQLKASLILGTYLSEEYHSRYYAKAQNLARELARAYDEALADVDVLALPTVAEVAGEFETDDSYDEMIERLYGQLGDAMTSTSNTAPFNATGHPAVSVPCGTVDGLPVGLQLVGERFRDDAVLQAAHAVERQTEFPL